MYNDVVKFFVFITMKQQSENQRKSRRKTAQNIIIVNHVILSP